MNEKYLVWPKNINDIIITGFTFTELWMLKEKVEQDMTQIVFGPQQMFSSAGQEMIILSDCAEDYFVVVSQAKTGWRPTIGSITKVEKERVQEIMINWQDGAFKREIRYDHHK